MVGCHVNRCVCHRDWKGGGALESPTQQIGCVVYQGFNVHRIIFFYLKDVNLLSQYVHE